MRGEGREGAFLVMWPRRLCALNPPLRVRAMVRVSIRGRVADCCIQTTGESDKMRISHVIKADQWRSDPLRSSICLVPSQTHDMNGTAP